MRDTIIELVNIREGGVHQLKQANLPKSAVYLSGPSKMKVSLDLNVLNFKTTEALYSHDEDRWFDGKKVDFLAELISQCRNMFDVFNSTSPLYDILDKRIQIWMIFVNSWMSGAGEM